MEESTLRWPTDKEREEMEDVWQFRIRTLAKLSHTWPQLTHSTCISAQNSQRTVIKLAIQSKQGPILQHFQNKLTALLLHLLQVLNKQINDDDDDAMSCKSQISRNVPVSIAPLRCYVWYSVKAYVAQNKRMMVLKCREKVRLIYTIHNNIRIW